MSKTLWQVLYQVDGLIPPQVQLKRRLWLRKGEILLEKDGGSLKVHMLHKGANTFQSEDKILPYFKLAPLLSSNSVHLEGGSAVAIPSEEEFGKDTKSYLHAKVSIRIPDEAVDQIEEHVPGFLRQLRKVHDKYIAVINDNRFLSVAVDFLFESNNKSVYTDEGFLCAVICLEALFNEGPSDISYKIAHRAALLLGLERANAIEVSRHLKSVYRDRSRLVHGRGSLDGVGNPDRDKVIHYARVSIMMFLILLSKAKRRQISANKRKEALLNEIDCALLDTAKRGALQREIEQGMSNFALEVPRTFEGKGPNGGYRVTAW